MKDRVCLLVRAALLDDARGLAAWTEWRAHAAGDLLPEERQLAPTVARALARRGVDDPALRRLAPYAEQAWLANQATGALAAAVLGELQRAGIVTLVFKGAALVRRYYRDPAARRCGDVDILVPERQLFAAWDRLAADGWRAVAADRAVFDPRFAHAVQLFDSHGRSVDLHCHVFAPCCWAGCDDPFWKAAVPFDLDGVATSTLCPTDHLLHACVHGQLRGFVRPVRWYADAVMISRVAGQDVDWDRFVRLAGALGVTRFALAALDDLVEIVELVVPPGVLRALRAARTGVVDAMLFRSWTADSRGRPILRLWFHVARFLRGTAGLGARERVRALPRFLRVWLGKDSWIRIVGRLLFRAARAVLIRLGLMSREVVTRAYLKDLLRARSSRD